jgi:hypothetical protein
MESIDTVLVFFLTNGSILASEGTVSYFKVWYDNQVKDCILEPQFFPAIHPDTRQAYLVGLRAVQSIADVKRENVQAGGRKILTPRDN